MRFPAIGPASTCRLCGHGVDQVKVAHRACLEDVLARLRASEGVRAGGPVRLGAILDGGAR